MHELSTVYGAEDLQDLFEIVMVDNYNEWLANQTEDE